MTTDTSITLWRIPQSTAAEQNQLRPLIEQTEQQLTSIRQRFTRITLANSLAIEDLILIDIIARLHIEMDIFILNTGKLHAETLRYLQDIQQRYPTLQYRIYEPLDHELQHFAVQYAFSDIYTSLTVRQACCYARKIEPLQRALAGYDAWITGQRREQASTRSQLLEEEFDQAHALHKFNPLATWTQRDVWAYVQQQNVPINPLYHQGIPSIGCDPCTKPIRQHEDLRAGRWWWENQQSKECGLHQNQTAPAITTS